MSVFISYILKSHFYPLSSFFLLSPSGLINFHGFRPSSTFLVIFHSELSWLSRYLSVFFCFLPPSHLCLKSYHNAVCLILWCNLTMKSYIIHFQINPQGTFITVWRILELTEAKLCCGKVSVRCCKLLCIWYRSVWHLHTLQPLTTLNL